MTDDTAVQKEQTRLALSAMLIPIFFVIAFAICIIGTYHNVSREYLHRYLWQFDFVWNTRKLNDGERTIEAIKAAEGKRLMYSEATAPHA